MHANRHTSCVRTVILVTACSSNRATGRTTQRCRPHTDNVSPQSYGLTYDCVSRSRQGCTTVGVKPSRFDTDCCDPCRCCTPLLLSTLRMLLHTHHS